MKQKLKAIGAQIRAELKFYRLLVQDPRLPRLPKWIPGLAIAYAISPIDLIPDVIPIIGHLDDILILPFLTFLALRLIPKNVIDDCR